MSARFLVICFFMCLISLPVAAQNYVQDIERVSELNRISPLQNPKYDKAEDVLSRRILDRKNKVVGHVEDVIIGENGALRFLNADLDSLRLGSISFNYGQMGIKSVSNAYALSIDEEQVENLFPTLLAEMETAAGSEDDVFSVRKIMGASVKAKDGRSIGKVSEVLFGGDATRVEALNINVRSGALRDENVAVPFGRAMEIKDVARTKVIIVSNSMADAVLAYAKENK